MDIINICTQLTGFFPSKSVGSFKKAYELIWAVLLFSIPIVALYGATTMPSYKLVEIITAIQGPALAFRLSFCVTFFYLRKARYVELLEEKREVRNWMKMLVFKSDASTKVLQKSSQTYTAITFFYMPFFTSVLALFNIFFLPMLLMSSKNAPISADLNVNSTVVNPNNETQKKLSDIGQVLVSIAIFLFASIVGLKRRCMDFLIVKMYLHIIQETKFLTGALTATFNEKRAFFQKVNLSNWLKCKARVMR